MIVITDYVPPTAFDLAKLKNALGYTGAQMAELAGVCSNSQWRKYTSGETPRPISSHILFFAAAQLALNDSEMHKVLTKMKEIGATFKDCK
ncbi:helix-turn-helix domain-containing protein [Enterobacter soli]|uniref:helix-turn-helix domain-containing protein n=1 Tax=Enterobacter soli TaxID=885040 RepID=UPI00237876A8|nr:helix-turn-helix transcriptional regulator [Enterobacter soli]MDD9245214.1 helix-turn-helix transcriptional regulator [Enterobacter soli]